VCVDKTIEKLGHGTFANVFKVMDLKGEIYALKAIRTKFKKKKNQEDFKITLQREIDLGLLSRISSPFLVKYHSVFPVYFIFCFFFIFICRKMIFFVYLWNYVHMVLWRQK
jgi:serine/threonine protein kinase